MPGKLTLVIGPMFAGKTTELQRRVKRDIHACRQVCIIKYTKDVRYSEHIASHDKALLRPTFAVETLADVGDKWMDYDTIAIDEGQFFPDVVDFCRAAADAGKTVIVSALDGDFLRRPFGRVCELVPLAEEVVKITAVCMACHERDAHFTRRTVDSTATELIGGADMYIAVCRDCYNAPNPPTPGRMSRYKQNVKSIEQVTLMQQQQKAKSASMSVNAAANGGDSNMAPPPPLSAGAATDMKKEPLRRQRDENSQPCSQQPSGGVASKRLMAPQQQEHDDDASNLEQAASPMAASPPKMPML